MMATSQAKNNMKKIKKILKLVTSKHEETMTESKKINDGCRR